jgi:deoxyribonuclease-4
MKGETVAKRELLLGAHTSAAGGVQNALYEGQAIGATCIQLFTTNQKRWDSKPYTEELLEHWFKAKAQTGLKKIMSHDSYLINLGAPDPDILAKSRKAFKEEIHRCQQLKLDYLNFHPGAAIKESPQKCLDTIVESLLECEKMTEGSPLRLLFEATAGQGSCVGYKFEELGYLIEKTHKKIPVGICIDTCHIFAAGYDIRTAEGWDSVLKEFDRLVGLKHLYAFHINDSMKGLGTRVDRHDFIGKGLIGLECFKFLVNDPRTRELPMYLETPGGPEIWKEEIKLIRELAHA